VLFRSNNLAARQVEFKGRDESFVALRPHQLQDYCGRLVPAESRPYPLLTSREHFAINPQNPKFNFTTIGTGTAATYDLPSVVIHITVEPFELFIQAIVFSTSTQQTLFMPFHSTHCIRIARLT
jgi:hypothetical protein